MRCNDSSDWKYCCYRTFFSETLLFTEYTEKQHFRVEIRIKLDKQR